MVSSITAHSRKLAHGAAQIFGGSFVSSATFGSLSLAGAAFCLYKALIQPLPHLYLPLDQEWQSAWQAAQLARVSPEVSAETDVYVEVSGAVVKPGVFRLSSASRIQDAMLQAGGFLEMADQAYIHQKLNLASRVTDQSKIYIPFQGESSAVVAQGDDSNGGASSSSSRTINSLSLAELDAIPGIGEARAATVLQGMPYSDAADFQERSGLPANIATEVLALYSF